MALYQHAMAVRAGRLGDGRLQQDTFRLCFGQWQDEAVEAHRTSLIQIRCATSGIASQKEASNLFAYISTSLPNPACSRSPKNSRKKGFGRVSTGEVDVLRTGHGSNRLRHGNAPPAESDRVPEFDP
jgi:hypothetical protein